MSEQSSPAPSEASPESLFVGWLARREAGEAADLEEICRSNPEAAERLRSLARQHEELEELKRRFGFAGSIAERLATSFGSEVDPKVELEGEDAGDFTSKLLGRLSGRGSASSRYRLKGEVASGGMGAILRVWDEDLRRHLAMKVVLGRGEAPGPGKTPPVDKRLLARFLEEAQVTGQLDHPGIVPVHELGLDAEGHVYFTMKLVKGRDLKAIFDLVREEKEGWNQVKALGVLLKVCEAMSYAHDKGVIHRDLKPANVMVGRYGEVFVMDWGLARILGREDDKDIRLRPVDTSGLSAIRTDRKEGASDTPDSPLYTMDGDVVGTPAYMPPEQAAGSLETMGPHSDVYAVGAMLYHLLAGHMPYVREGEKASNYMVLRWVKDGPPHPLEKEAPNSSAELAAICDKAMSRDIRSRYPDMAALDADLSAYIEGKVVAAYETGTWAETKKWVQRNKALASALFAAVLAVVMGTLAIARQSIESSKRFAAEALAAQSENGARWQDYVASIRGASAALEKGLVPSAIRFLREAPKEHRNWEWNLLSTAADNSEMTFRINDDPIKAVAWRPDGQLLVAASQHGWVFECDPQTGQVSEVLANLGGYPAALWCGQDSILVATVDRNYTFSINDPVSGIQLGTGALDWYLVQARFSMDGSQLVAYDLSGKMYLFDSASGRVLGETQAMERGHGNPEALLLWGTDGCLVSFSDSSDERLYDFDLGAWIGRRQSAGWSLKEAQVSGPLSIAAEASLLVRDTPGGSWRQLPGFSAWGQPATAIAASNRRPLFAVGTEAGRIAIYDARIAGSIRLFAGHEGAITALAWRPGDHQIASGSDDGSVRMWSPDWRCPSREWLAVHNQARDEATDLRAGWPVVELGHVYGDHIACGGPFGPRRTVLRAGQFNVYRQRSAHAEILALGQDSPTLLTLPDWMPVWTLDLESGEYAKCAAWFEGASRCAIGTSAGRMLIVDGDSGRIVASLNAGTQRLIEVSDLHGYPLLVAATEGELGFWSLPALQLVWSFAFPSEIDHMAVVGPMVFVLTDNGDMWSTDAEGIQPSMVFKMPDADWITAVPQLGLVLIASQTELACWDCNTQRIRFRVGVNGLQSWEGALAVDDGAQVVYAGTNDGSILRFDLRTGTALAPLGRHAGEVLALAHSPEGKRVASVGADRTLRIWDTEHDEELLALPGEGKALSWDESGVNLVWENVLLSVARLPLELNSTQRQARHAWEEREAVDWVDVLIRGLASRLDVLESIDSEPAAWEELRELAVARVWATSESDWAQARSAIAEEVFGGATNDSPVHWERLLRAMEHVSVEYPTERDWELYKSELLYRLNRDRAATEALGRSRPGTPEEARVAVLLQARALARRGDIEDAARHLADAAARMSFTEGPNSIDSRLLEEVRSLIRGDDEDR